MKLTVPLVFKWKYSLILFLALSAAGFLFFRAGISAPAADYVAVLKTSGITCDSCANRIEKSIGEVPGVASVGVDVGGGRVRVAYDSKSVNPGKFAERLTALGYASKLFVNMPFAQYRKMTGWDGGSRPSGNAGACGGGCCDNNRG